MCLLNKFDVIFNDEQHLTILLEEISYIEYKAPCTKPVFLTF